MINKLWKLYEIICRYSEIGISAEQISEKYNYSLRKTKKRIRKLLKDKMIYQNGYKFFPEEFTYFMNDD